MHSPWKQADVDLQVWEIQSKNVEKFRRVPENGQSLVLKSLTLRPQEQFAPVNGWLWINARQPTKPSENGRTHS